MWRVHHLKCQAGWITSWNQDCWEKHQQTQICKWYHSQCRKWRATKKPLDEGERWDWKSWLKTEHSKNKDHGTWPHHFMAHRWGKTRSSDRFYFLGPQRLWTVTAALKLTDACSLEEKLWQTQNIKNQRHYFAVKGPSSQSYSFSSSHIWMWAGP